MNLELKEVEKSQTKVYNNFLRQKEEIMLADIDAFDTDASFMERRIEMLPEVIAEAKKIVKFYYKMNQDMIDFTNQESERIDLDKFDDLISKVSLEYIYGDEASLLKKDSRDKLLKYYASLRNEFKNVRKTLEGLIGQNDVKHLTYMLNRLKVGLKERDGAQVAFDDEGHIIESIGIVNKDRSPQIYKVHI